MRNCHYSTLFSDFLVFIFCTHISNDGGILKTQQRRIFQARRQNTADLNRGQMSSHWPLAQISRLLIGLNFASSRNLNCARRFFLSSLFPRELERVLTDAYRVRHSTRRVTSPSACYINMTSYVFSCCNSSLFHTFILNITKT